MANNHYESVVIINAALEDTQVEDVIKKIENFIKTNEGSITSLEKWGRKRLAYPIKKSKSGYYVIFRFTAVPSLIAKLERIYRLDESVYRYLTIKLNKKDLEHIQKKAEKVEKTEEIPAKKNSSDQEVKTNAEEQIESN